MKAEVSMGVSESPSTWELSTAPSYTSDSGDARRPRRDVVAAIASILFLQTFRFPVHAMAPGVDDSYMHVLNRLAFGPEMFGTDIVYTFGPLGFLLSLENVGSNLIIGFVFWAAMYGMFTTTAAYWIVRRLCGIRLIAAAVTLFAVGPWIDVERLPICLALLIAIVGNDLPQARNALLSVGGIVVGVSFLIKIPTAVSAAAALASGCLVPFVPTQVLRRSAVVCASSLITINALWFALYGTFRGTFAYVTNTLELVSGYAATMAVPMSSEAITVGCILAASGCVLGLMWALPKPSNRLMTFAAAFPLLVAWKHGVVRFDYVHFQAFVSVILWLTCLIVIYYLTTAHFLRGLFGGTFVASCLGLAVWTSGTHYIVMRPFWFQGARAVGHAVRWNRTVARLDRRSDQQLAGNRLSDELSTFIGTRSVDIYSWELGLVAGNPTLNYRPKPVFQHFNAFTPTLDELNAAFFRSPRRPDVLLLPFPSYSTKSVDERHMLFDDPKAIWEIIDRYRLHTVARSVPQVAVLEASKQPSFRSKVIRSQAVRWNETIAIEKENPAAVQIVDVDARPTFAARAKGVAYRPTRMFIHYILEDGTEHRYRLMPTHMKDGIWIDPLFVDFDQFFEFLAGRAIRGGAVRSIRFEAESPSDYEGTLNLVWREVHCEDRPCRTTPRDSVVYENSAELEATAPVALPSILTTAVPYRGAAITEIEVCMYNYGREIAGESSVALEVLDEHERVLERSEISANTVGNGRYHVFAFAELAGLENKPVKLRLKTAEEVAGKIAVKYDAQLGVMCRIRGRDVSPTMHVGESTRKRTAR